MTRLSVPEVPRDSVIQRALSPRDLMLTTLSYERIPKDLGTASHLEALKSR